MKELQKKREFKRKKLGLLRIEDRHSLRDMKSNRDLRPKGKLYGLKERLRKKHKRRLKRQLRLKEKQMSLQQMKKWKRRDYIRKILLQKKLKL